MLTPLRAKAALVAGSLCGAACTPQKSSHETATTTAPPALVAGSLRSAAAVPATNYDTLHVPSGVVRVRPRRADDYARLPVGPQLVPERPAEAPTSPGRWDSGRVLRQANALRLRPVAGPMVSFHDVPNRQPPDAVSDGGTYQYRGQWSGAGFWLVEYDGLPRSFFLVEQRTGRRVQLASPDAVFSRDGHYLLLNARYMDGQAPPYGLALYQLCPTGALAKLIWLRDLPHWGTLSGARWADQRTVMVQRTTIPEHPNAVPLVSYVELQLPAPPR